MKRVLTAILIIATTSLGYTSRAQDDGCSNCGGTTHLNKKTSHKEKKNNVPPKPPKVDTPVAHKDDCLDKIPKCAPCDVKAVYVSAKQVEAGAYVKVYWNTFGKCTKRPDIVNLPDGATATIEEDEQSHRLYGFVGPINTTCTLKVVFYDGLTGDPVPKSVSVTVIPKPNVAPDEDFTSDRSWAHRNAWWIAPIAIAGLSYAGYLIYDNNRERHHDDPGTNQTDPHWSNTTNPSDPGTHKPGSTNGGSGGYQNHPNVVQQQQPQGLVLLRF